MAHNTRTCGRRSITTYTTHFHEFRTNWEISLKNPSRPISNTLSERKKGCGKSRKHRVICETRSPEYDFQKKADFFHTFGLTLRSFKNGWSNVGELWSYAGHVMKHTASWLSVSHQTLCWPGQESTTPPWTCDTWTKTGIKQCVCCFLMFSIICQALQSFFMVLSSIY